MSQSDNDQLVRFNCFEWGKYHKTTLFNFNLDCSFIWTFNWRKWFGIIISALSLLLMLITKWTTTPQWIISLWLRKNATPIQGFHNDICRCMFTWRYAISKMSSIHTFIVFDDTKTTRDNDAASSTNTTRLMHIRIMMVAKRWSALFWAISFLRFCAFRSV